MELQDTEIIQDILNGNKERYAILMRKYNPRLYRVCKGYLKDESEIEDVMQDTYVKAYQNLSKFENRSQFITWLTKISINECLQRLKRINKYDYSEIIEENELIITTADNNNPEKNSMNSELKRMIEEAINHLPEKYRVIFMLREIERMSTEETSTLLEITESNVKIRLSRAKEMLRSTLLSNYQYSDLFEFNLVRCERIQTNVLARI